MTRWPPAQPPGARRTRSSYANDPTAPFGGIKASGLGRELGPEGLLSNKTLKTIYLDQRQS